MLSILHQIDSSFSGVLDVVKGDLSAVKTGRAKPELIANIPISVESYASAMTLQELASITAVDSQSLLIVPWDKNIIEDITKGIAKSELNLNPQSDGNVIRIIIPPLTGERRVELTRLVDKKVEAGMILLRDERKHLKQQIDSQKGQPGVSEDDIFHAVEELDKKTREWEEKIDAAGEAKKQELMSV